MRRLLHDHRTVVPFAIIARRRRDGGGRELARRAAEPRHSRRLRRSARRARRRRRARISTQRITEMEARLAAQPDDVRAAVLLADALLRQTRVTGNAGLARPRRAGAEEARSSTIPATTTRIGCSARCTCRSTGSATRSRSAEKSRAARPYDPVNYGVIGDGHLELGDYERGVRRLRSHDAAAAERGGVRARGVRARAAGQSRRRDRVDEAGGRRDQRRRSRGARLDARADRRAVSSARASCTTRSRSSPSRRRRFPAIRSPSSATRRRSRRKAIATGALTLLQDLARTSPTPDLAARIGDLLERLGRHDEAPSGSTRSPKPAGASTRPSRRISRAFSRTTAKVDEAVASRNRPRPSATTSSPRTRWRGRTSRPGASTTRGRRSRSRCGPAPRIATSARTPTAIAASAPRIAAR